MTATADKPTATAAETLIPPSSRVSLLVGDTQIDLLLPAAVPLAKLVEPTRDTINRRLKSIGAKELPGGAFVFARAAGMTMLSGKLSLAAQGVNDAELLAFVPAATAQRYEPNIENVSAAIAKWAKEHFPAVTALDAARVAVALTLLAFSIAALLVWRLRWASSGGWLVPTIFAITALVLAGTSLLAARMGADRFVTGSTTWAVLVALVAAGATTPPGGHPGAPHGVLAAGVALVAAAALGKLSGRYWVAATTVVTVSVAALGSAASRMFFAVPGQRIAVVVLVGVLTVSLAAPGIGRRLARVPRQSFESITGKDMYERSPSDPEDTISPVADSPRDITLTGEQVGEVALRSNRVLMGLLLGNALTQVVASWFAIHPGVGTQWTFVAVAACIGLIAVLRARAFRDRRHAITLVAGAAVSLFAIPTHYGFAASPGATGVVLASAAAVVGIALAALLAGAIVPTHMFSEPVREVVEYAEYFATTVVVVFAAWTIDLIQFVRYH
ncbi:type VII secretion integral membrane protein EccD (plasmid) [Mycobacterium sp. Aquia_216]|uniref:type VII secretion integral membrane protein EccD n=1 Tax=Mycobacterium sp. Aquia_216 TaxID=2991729 RepID=UPI00227AD9EB|nr:type VII secretion integral membrane protein EccD [Mycobacterium sp. Aquia_216]WAJ48003.1 type VII secretion integral membrane protein EccD [Mycobacterium sp. Aquia_216]